MANITITEAAEFIPEIWAATALGKLKANTVMARLVNRDWEDNVANFGDTLHIPKRGTLTVNNKAANTQITLQTPTATKVDLLLDQYKEVSFLVEDIAAAQANQSIVDGYIEDAIMAIAETIDASLLALYPGFTATAIDGTTTFNEALITEAGRILNNARAPFSDRSIVWSADAQKKLLALGQFVSAQYDPQNATALEEATLGRKYGFSHYMDQQVVLATDQKNIAFHKDCMTLAMRPMPAPPTQQGVQSATMSEDGFGIRVMWQYSILFKGVIVSLDVLYGVKVVRPEFGVVIRSAAGA